MATLSAATIDVAGITTTLAAAAAGGDLAPVGSGLFLIVKNGDATSKTVTLATPGLLPTGDAYPDKAYTVAAGAQVLIPLLPLYRDPADGYAHITYSAVTQVTVGAYSV